MIFLPKPKCMSYVLDLNNYTETKMHCYILQILQVTQFYDFRWSPG